MTDLHTHDPLHEIIRGALAEDADRAPSLRTQWFDADVVHLAPNDARRPRHLVAIGVAALAITAAAVVIVRASIQEDAPSTVSTWVPEGTEFPLTDLGPATTVPIGPAVAALTRQLGVEGHPPQVIATTLGYWNSDTATEWVCTSEHGSSGCRPVWMTWSTSITSSVDNGYADYDLWTIEGLPAGTAFVSYADGNQLLWQRPIFGFAAFPNVEGSQEVVVAYDITGAELGRFGGHQGDSGFTNPFPLFADLSDQDRSRLDELAREGMTQCLVAHGGAFESGNVATFPDEVDQIVIWTQCVTVAKQVVGDAVKALNPRFYDPTTEPPGTTDPTATNDN